MILARLDYLFDASLLLVTAGIGAVFYLRLRRSWEEIVVFQRSRVLVGRSAEKQVFNESQLAVMSDLHNERMRMELEQLEIRSRIRALAQPNASISPAVQAGEKAPVQVREGNAERPSLNPFSKS